MRIPGNALRQSHLNSYGAGGIQLMPGLRHGGCPRYYRMKYVEHKIPEGMRKMELEYGSVVHRALFLMEEKMISPDDALREAWSPTLGPGLFDEALRDLTHAIEKGGILPLLATLEVEFDLSVPLYEDEDFGPIEIAGRLDGAWIHTEDLSTLYVGDYKTDRSPPSREKLREWIQGRHYALLAQRSLDRWFDDPSQVERITVLYEAVKWNTLDVTYTDDEIESYAAWAEAVARRILRDKKGKPELNPFCNWCEVRSTCPAWRDLPKVGTTLIERLRSMTLDEQVANWPEVQEVKKLISAMHFDIRDAIYEKVEAEGPYESEAMGKVWSLEEGTKKEFDVRRLHQILGDDFYDIVSVGIGKLDDWKVEHIDKAGKVDQVIDYVPTGKLSLKERKLDA